MTCSNTNKSTKNTQTGRGQNQTEVFMKKKTKGMFSLSIILEGVILFLLNTYPPRSHHKHDKNYAFWNPSRQLITSNCEIWCFVSLMIRKKEKILLRSHREARKFQIGSNFQISMHVFIQYCKYKSVLHTAICGTIYHFSRGTPTQWIAELSLKNNNLE